MVRCDIVEELECVLDDGLREAGLTRCELVHHANDGGDDCACVPVEDSYDLLDTFLLLWSVWWRVVRSIGLRRFVEVSLFETRRSEDFEEVLAVVVALGSDQEVVDHECEVRRARLVRVQARGVVVWVVAVLSEEFVETLLSTEVGLWETVERLIAADKNAVPECRSGAETARARTVAGCCREIGRRG